MDDVRAIKTDPLRHTQQYWARLLGVRIDTIGKIKRGERWRHVT